MKKKEYKPNKYDIEIDALFAMKKKIMRKVYIIVAITSIIGLSVMISAFKFTEYSLYLLIGGAIIATLGLRYGEGRKRTVNRYVNSQIRTIEDEETRDRLRKQK